jgi:molybdenum cofactor cytidylyltransferase
MSRIVAGRPAAALAWRVIVPMVLAAGASTRMGAPKALLPDGTGRVFVTRLLYTCAAGGFRDVIVVTGTMHDRIVSAVSGDTPAGMRVTFARNPDPSRGQLSSLLVGLDTLPSGAAAVMVMLVDVPLVAVDTLIAVRDAYERTRAPIVRPARGARHGHPVLFDQSLFGELHRADPAVGAKAVVHAHGDAVVNVDTADEGAFLDIDTPDEYDRAVPR